MSVTTTSLFIAILGTSSFLAQEPDETESKIASALSAGPASVTEGAMVVDMDGTVLRDGDNGWVCHPESAGLGAMCNSGEWGDMISALMRNEDFSPTQMSMSYMLAGEGAAPGVSNIDPYATGPTEDNQWIKDGPHLMMILPDPAMLEGVSTDPADPIYVMWKDTPYAHIMIRIEETEGE